MDALKKGKVDSVLVDMYTPLKRKDLFNGTWFEVAKLLETEISHGVLLQGGAVNIADELLKIIVAKNVQTEYLQDRNDKQRNEVSTNHPSKSYLPFCMNTIAYFFNHGSSGFNFPSSDIYVSKKNKFYSLNK